MNTDKKIARIVGALFLISFISMIGTSFTESILTAPLNDIYPNRIQVIIGALFWLINNFAVVGIAVMLFLILKKHNEIIALGYVGFRVVECAILTVGVISQLLLITLSQEYIKAGAPAASYFQTIGILARNVDYWAFKIGGLIICPLGGLMLCYLLYQSKLIPRIISVVGLTGYAGLLTSVLLEMFGYNTGMVLYLPGSLFEIILFPIWLIVKGFNSSAIASGSAKQI